MQKEATYKVLDYDPFGMQMPSRSFTGASGYKFGFNGMLKDGKDWTGNNDSHLDFGARIYDSRLGRWLSLDPLMAKNSSLSPYNSFANNSIYYTVPDGKEHSHDYQKQGEKTVEGNKLLKKGIKKSIRATQRNMNRRKNK